MSKDDFKAFFLVCCRFNGLLLHLWIPLCLANPWEERGGRGRRTSCQLQGGENRRGGQKVVKQNVYGGDVDEYKSEEVKDTGVGGRRSGSGTALHPKDLSSQRFTSPQ